MSEKNKIEDEIKENKLNEHNEIDIESQEYEEVINCESEENNNSKNNIDFEENVEEVDVKVKTKKNNPMVTMGVVTLVSSLISSGTTMLVMGEKINSIKTSAPIVVSEDDSKDSVGLNIYQAVAKKASPSVVGIMTTSFDKNNIFSIPVESSGVGTGVIVDSRGYILTNSHVVSMDGEGKISVVLSDGKNLDGAVLWQDAGLDLAVIKIDGSGYVAAELGDSDEVTVGDISIAIGNPIGLEFQTTVTQGIISGINRNIEANNFSMDGLLQTDASINPGNSGGPLLNSKGQVIGINTAKTSNAEGIGFAIPINVAKPIVEQIIKTGTFEKVMLGIRGMSLASFESLVGTDLIAEKGVYIVEVEDGTPAKKSGIRNGDVIEVINGEEISDMNGLTKELYKFKSGDSCEVVVNRSGEKVKLNVRFDKK